jgi:hypothetical protein
MRSAPPIDVCNGYDQESLDVLGFLFHVLIDLNDKIQLNNVF